MTTRVNISRYLATWYIPGCDFRRWQFSSASNAHRSGTASEFPDPAFLQPPNLDMFRFLKAGLWSSFLEQKKKKKDSSRNRRE